MTPPARAQAAIELLDLILAGQASADTIIAEWFRARRFAGSGDRRAIRELVYRVIRTFGERPASGRSALVGLARVDAAVAALFDGSGYGPAAIGEGEAGEVPRAMPVWLGGMIDAGEHNALLGRAPLDLRVNALKGGREAVLALLPGAEPIAGLAHGVRLAEPVAVENLAAFREGLFEVQDAGSQFVVAACAVAAGMTVVDLCAGGGGKTLGVAGQMQVPTPGPSLGREGGRLIACDTERARLAKLGPRAVRAGAEVEVRLLDGGREAEMLGDLKEQADVVLVDAPCTGSGTLRRNPEARWRITPERLERMIATQRHVLDLAVPLVKPGGALVYAVCSLIEVEGGAQVEAFLARHEGWSLDMARTLTPSRDKTDGFYVARLVRAC